MDLYSYIVEHDMGFAPNPFFGVCTLAACKPIIRRRIQKGDFVMGTGGAKRARTGHLVFWLRVGDIMTFDQYSRDLAYRNKRPQMNGSLKAAFGDNIYSKDEGGVYQQAYSFHSNRDGSRHYGNYYDDVGKTDKIILSTDFAYFGGSGPKVPDDLDRYVHKGRNHLRFNEGSAAAAINWLTGMNERGYVAEPTEWPYVRRRRRLGR